MAGEASGGPRGQGQQGREGQSRKARLQSQCRGGQEPHGEKQACRSLRWTCRGAEGRRSREGLATSTEAQVLRAVPRDHRRLMSAFRKPAGAEGRCSERGLRSPIAPRPPPPTLGTGAPLHTCFFFFYLSNAGRTQMVLAVPLVVQFFLSTCLSWCTGGARAWAILPFNFLM